jgi:hypothetical protein
MEKRSKITGFIHIYAVNDYRSIVANQERIIAESGLYAMVDEIYYVVIGDNQFRIEGERYTLLAQSMNMKLSENFTLNLLRDKAISRTDNFQLFYIHTKGVTKPTVKSIQDWRAYMEYFNISCWPYCLDALEHSDAVGVNRRVFAKKRVHFNGNFWWANSSYIKTLPELSSNGYGRKVNRWDGEFWIGDGNPITTQLWNSRIHHQTRQYGPVHYEKKLNMIRFGKKV